MSDFVYQLSEDSDFLVHHGIKGQKWGERRFQNPDGTLTPEGKERYRQYVKDFGKEAADRIMNDIKKGKKEKQAFEKEYNRRSNLTPANIVGNIAALGGSTAIGALVKSKTGDSRLAVAADLGSWVTSMIAIEMGTKKINQIKNSYSKYDMSKEGLEDFYDKMKEYRRNNK